MVYARVCCITRVRFLKGLWCIFLPTMVVNNTKILMMTFRSVFIPWHSHRESPEAWRKALLEDHQIDATPFDDKNAKTKSCSLLVRAPVGPPPMSDSPLLQPKGGL